MIFNFFKYSGLGNDFVLIEVDDILVELKSFRMWKDRAVLMCNRFQGIGGDGVILFEKTKSFNMVTINSDGSFATMCGNAARCSVAHFFNNNKTKNKPKIFFQYLQIVSKNGKFEPLTLSAERMKDKFKVSWSVVNAVLGPYKILNYEWLYLNTGTDHVVTFIKNKKEFELLDVVKIGEKIRNHKQFQPRGTNVNFVLDCGNKLYLRTYERGVESETLSCGTGSSAAVAIKKIRNKLKNLSRTVIQRSGEELLVRVADQNNYLGISQTGCVKYIYKGMYESTI